MEVSYCKSVLDYTDDLKSRNIIQEIKRLRITDYECNSDATEILIWQKSCFIEFSENLSLGKMNCIVGEMRTPEK